LTGSIYSEVVMHKGSMCRDSIAEWILRQVTSRQRACAIVGDLLEGEHQKGRLWFWLSVGRIAISLFWRRPVAFISALYVGSWTLFAFDMATHGIHTRHRPPDYPWGTVFEFIGYFTSGLCAIALYAAIRYGIWQRSTQMVLIWAGLGAAVIYLW